VKFNDETNFSKPYEKQSKQATTDHQSMQRATALLRFAIKTNPFSRKYLLCYIEYCTGCHAKVRLAEQSEV